MQFRGCFAPHLVITTGNANRNLLLVRGFLVPSQKQKLWQAADKLRIEFYSEPSQAAFKALAE